MMCILLFVASPVKWSAKCKGKMQRPLQCALGIIKQQMGRAVHFHTIHYFFHAPSLYPLLTIFYCVCSPVAK